MLLSCGDALIDFLPVKSLDGRDAIVPVAGGSCLNVAVGMARLGVAARFVGGISNDLFGRIVADHALASGVGLGYATRSDHQCTLAFVRTIDGEPQYAFYDEGSASRNWTYRSGSIPFGEVSAIHVGSTTLVGEAGAAQASAMIGEAKGSATISFDPNCRPNLVKDKRAYVARMAGFAAGADIVRMSDVDFGYLHGHGDHAKWAASMLAAGVSLVVITRGAQGVQAWHGNAGMLSIEAPEIAIVDTIGAGDSFQAALLYALDALGRIKTEALRQIDADELRRVLSFAMACAAITCGRVGADPPWRADLGAEMLQQLRRAKL
jgi:fructokinase